MKLYRYAYLATAPGGQYLGEVSACCRGTAINRVAAQLRNLRLVYIHAIRLSRGKFIGHDWEQGPADWRAAREEIGDFRSEAQVYGEVGR